jgi:hypothetical protein
LGIVFVGEKNMYAKELQARLLNVRARISGIAELSLHVAKGRFETLEP